MTSLVEFDGQILDTYRSDHAAILSEVYGRPRKGQLPLWCNRPHRGRMYLRKVNGQLWAVHYPGQGGPACAVRIGGEGPAHEHIKEYSARAAENAGYTATPEYTTRNGTRLDVYIQAPFSFGVEAQVQPITTTNVKQRTTKSARAGIPPVWLAIESRTFPAPNIGYNRDTDWEPGIPPRGTVPALHMKHLTAGHCTAHGPFDHCPNKPGGFCNGWHPHYTALRGWTLDDAIAGIGAGALIFHQDQLGAVRIIPAEHLPVYRELRGHDGAFNPGGKAAKPLPAQRSRECVADRPAVIEAAEVKLADRAPLEITWHRCQHCGKPMCHSESLAAGLCQRHALMMQAAIRRVQLW